MTDLNLEVSAAPATEPWTVAEVKAHLRIDTSLTDDDTYLAALIVGVRQSLESLIGCSMFTQTRKRRLDGWPRRIYLPRPPIQSVSGIAYVDVDGNPQTLSTSVYAAYGLRTTPDADATLAYIERAWGQSWPSIRAVPEAITVTYVAGWKTAAAIPQPIRHAVLVALAELYENREDSVTGANVARLDAVRRLTDEYRARYLWDVAEECW